MNSASDDDSDQDIHTEGERTGSSAFALEDLAVMDLKQLSDVSWEAFASVAQQHYDVKASEVAKRMHDALGSRDYCLVVQTRLSSIKLEQREWVWLVRELCATFKNLSKVVAMSASRQASSVAMKNGQWEASVSSVALTELAWVLTRRFESWGGAMTIRLARWDGLHDVKALMHLCTAAGLKLHFLLGHLRRFRYSRLARARKRRLKLAEYKAGQAELHRRRRHFVRDDLKHRSSDEDVSCGDEEVDDLSESADSASSASSDGGLASSSTSSGSDEDELLQDEHWTSRRVNRCARRLSGTGVARFVARLERAGLLPLVWSFEKRDAVLAEHAARLLTRSAAAKPGAAGCPCDGAELALRSAKRAPQWIRPTLARRLLRVATTHASPTTRSKAKRALLAVVLRTASRDELISSLLDQTVRPGCVIDCISAALYSEPPPSDTLLANVLQSTLEKLLFDGEKGYDALQNDLDAHVAALNLARRLLMTGPDRFPVAKIALTDHKYRLEDLAATLRRRLRRPPLAPECQVSKGSAFNLAAVVTTPPVLNINDLFVSNLPPSFMNPDQSRYLLNLIAENLDYVVNCPLLRNHNATQ